MTVLRWFLITVGVLFTFGAPLYGYWLYREEKKQHENNGPNHRGPLN